MKKASFLILSVSLIALTITWIACGGNSPTSPSAPTPTPTITPTPNTNIYWNAAEIFGVIDPLSTNFQSVYVDLKVNGVPDSSVTGILSGTNISIPVTLSYGGTVVNNGVTCAHFSSTNFTYQVGATYTLTTITVAGTASKTSLAPGNASVSSDGLQASWTGGNNSSIQVVDNTYTTTYNSPASITSPFAIPITAYPSSGAYQVLVTSQNYFNSINNGSGELKVSEVSHHPVTLTINTSTPTNTRTKTSTPTNTPTFTYTPTLTPTVTPTKTFTYTNTMTSTKTFTSTFTSTLTVTLTPTQTFTSTLTDTFTPTPSFTPTLTPTNTPPVWHLVGAAGFSAGAASLINLSIDDNTLVPYVGYVDANYNNGEVAAYNGGWGNVLFNFAASVPQFLSVAASSSLDSKVYVADYDSVGNTADVTYYDNNTSTGANMIPPPFTETANVTIFKDGTTIYLAFVDASSSARNGWVLRNSGSGWTTVGGASFGTNCDIKLSLYVDTGSHTPYVAYDDITTSYITVRTLSGLGAWINAGSAGFARVGTAVNDLSINGSGSSVYLAFYNTGSASSEVWQLISNAWVRLGGAGFSSSQAYLSLAIYAGTPYVAFQDSAYSYAPSVMYYSGGSWQYLGIPGFTGSACSWVSLAFSAWPYVAFSDSAHGGKLSVYENY